MAKNSSSFYRYGLCSKNIDKAFANFEKSNSLHIETKNLSEELQREKQAPNIVKQNKTIPQGYKSSISTPISHVENLNKSRESGNSQGIVSSALYDNIVANF
ncbi:hypothetical protein [Rickettsia rickettsii]|uniref:Uncharacterized protein n=2 Tax=Rickettsia rickettsii TaxID=783 RepID=B0BXM9_RICRO|nr:hypothetical protein [Rickettsia rickettsii]ABV76236.1 hypothetical protein A1G_03525 [Rickettsia rickettsii str. 'Sheila Smith']ABY72605.1 hypothetical protein RrIowa_0747 [Rickettsia rickettsii str. Iowa]AFB22189.1 hypothetical protein RPN_03395 [Rickettsia rickettsii str. Brazil]AFB24930.1 hypothetical protein RPO_03540 [Rickettsia rickettsii str. Arizona]AFB27614.1 hypothetical protein RPJ_03510 [Rickettsia rickettsii str. Hino]